MATYDLYEIQTASIADARNLLERLLSMPFLEHDSSFHRGAYFAAGQKGEENFEIKVNRDPYEDVPNEDEYPDVKFLLYVNNTIRSSELNKIFADSHGMVNLLRHEEL